MELKINYGLMVIDPSEEGETKTILHFCGYGEPITDSMVTSLREELRDDPEFGLQDKWDTLDILEAPEEVVEEYKRIYELDKNN